MHLSLTKLYNKMFNRKSKYFLHNLQAYTNDS